MKIRQFRHEDLGFAQRIRALSGWNQTDADWKRMIHYQPDGCFVIECEGQAAGTATTTCYGGDLAWIGMILVDPEFRRRGLATALMEHCLKFLLEEKKIRCVRLDATPAGEAVYEKLGFKPEYELARWVNEETPEGRHHSNPEASLDTFATLDHEAFGANRMTYLEQLQKQSRLESAANGYGMIRPGEIANYLGPVVTRSEATGKDLIRKLLSRCPNPAPVFWDIPETNHGARHFAESLDFAPRRRLVRMWSGSKAILDRPDLQWAIGSPETG